ncbi:MAG TPA: hypothetical protein VGD65_00565 [Chryseosolibacter sp.]
MLIRYFRINDPYRLVGLLILMLIIFMPLLINNPGITIPELKSILIGERLNDGKDMYVSVVDNTAPLTAWFHEMMESLFGRSILARHIIAFTLMFLQAAYLGIMFITRKVFNENTYIPSFLFCLLFFISFDTLALTGDLIGFTFLLLALNNLFKEIEFRVQYDETIFNLGLFISIASLFSFAFSIYILWVMIVLVFFTRSTPRKFLLLVFGFLLPHLLVISIAYLNDSLGKMWDYYYLANLTFKRDVLMSASGILAIAILPLVFLVVSVVMLQREARLSKYQSQVLQIMFLWIGFTLVYFFYAKNMRPQNLIVFIPALALIFTHFFLSIRRRKFLELNSWALILGVITMGFLVRYNKIKAVDYSRLLVNDQNKPFKDKKVAVLADDLSWYRANKLGLPYLNWKLSQGIFLEPEYYENITEVYHNLNADDPDAIVDPAGLLEPFFNRFPQEKLKYVREGNVYLKRISN